MLSKFKSNQILSRVALDVFLDVKKIAMSLDYKRVTIKNDAESAIFKTAKAKVWDLLDVHRCTITASYSSVYFNLSLWVQNGDERGSHYQTSIYLGEIDRKGIFTTNFANLDHYQTMLDYTYQRWMNALSEIKKLENEANRVKQTIPHCLY